MIYIAKQSSKDRSIQPCIYHCLPKSPKAAAITLLYLKIDLLFFLGAYRM